MKGQGDFDGWEVWIEGLKDGKWERLNEYEEAHEVASGDKKQERHCWLESEPGQEFAFCLTDPNSSEYANDSYKVAYYADGNLVNSCIHTPFSLGTPSTTRTYKMRITQANQVMEAPLKFAKLSLSDDPTALSDLKAMVNLGTIRLELTSGTGWATGRGIAGGYQRPDLRPVHERSKKGLVGMRVEPGAVTPAKEASLANFYAYPASFQQARSHAFTFRYRTRGILAANGLIELPPEEPTGEERERVEREKEEADEETRIAELEAELNRMRAKRKVKTEHPVIPEPKRRLKGDVKGRSIANPIVLD
ncbi:hypothetical protein M231_02245 [Tremella mesenterica]|uniref:DUF7918 domain-containing protein n=1 Tax=Tremella mesenterica TaxID=5217 RepID=A0A4Q1BRB1_TREME|nr:hypothetical protein M231_02245 [Tremella mesenterica]